MTQGVNRHEQPRCAIAIMAKASIAGRTKTRLVPPLTENEAAMLNTAFLRDAADNIVAAARLANINGWVAYAPAGSEVFFRAHLPESFGLIETGAPTLGDCLRDAAAALLSAGNDTVCLINSDSPTLPVGYLVTAATVLAAASDRIVLGPSTDGGYYLIGMGRLHVALFDDIAWSTDRVLAQTLERAEALGLSVLVLPTWYDVDTAQTLRALVDEVLDGRPFRSVGAPTPATWTRACLATLVEEHGLGARIGDSRAIGIRS
ncbi:MAG: TIGR04282 family arsenosugar biosynthesis glycosyltransferase [Hyphomicrobiaceae bacterium]|nr:TIGR04282 family arsenosugar biosynthesis glycosyltransferase [Hyphomicrobiaceae bacterium]